MRMSPILLLGLCAAVWAGCAGLTQSQLQTFDNIFSLPREPRVSWGPGDGQVLEVPEGWKALITDVHVENLGGGRAQFVIAEQRLPNSYELRYVFNTKADETVTINFTTGLRLGDEKPIAGNLRVLNDSGSKARILARVNGVLVPP